MTRTIKKKVALSYPIEAVWDALSDPEQLSHWFMEGDFSPQEGAHFTFKSEGKVFDGEIISAQPPINLAYSWTDARLSHTTYVWWKLEDVRGRAVLELEHSGFKGVSDYLQSFRYGRYWSSNIKQLQKHLGIHAVQPA